MDEQRRRQLRHLAHSLIDTKDPSHDFWHAKRVVGYVKVLQREEGGDLDILIPAAWFHDIVNYPKNDARASENAHLSAVKTGDLLNDIRYPAHLIPLIKQAIEECSVKNGRPLSTLESRILHDADLLESIGAFAVMRYGASSALLRRRFVNPNDPLCTARKPILTFDEEGSTLDVMVARTELVKARLSTVTARALAVPRFAFMKMFMEQLHFELEQSLSLRPGQSSP